MNRRTRPPKVVRSDILETILIAVTGILAVAVIVLVAAGYALTR